MRLELCNVDYRVFLRVNGREVVATTDAQYAPDVARLLQDRTRDVPLPQAKIRAGRRQCRVEHLALARDVFYLNSQTWTGGQLWADPDRPVELGDDEYFVLGDNSFISGDARTWTEWSGVDYKPSTSPTKTSTSPAAACPADSCSARPSSSTGPPATARSRVRRGSSRISGTCGSSTDVGTRVASSQRQSVHPLSPVLRGEGGGEGPRASGAGRRAGSSRDGPSPYPSPLRTGERGPPGGCIASYTASTSNASSGTLRSTLTRGPSGRHRAGSVGPNRLTVGMPRIPARWPGPLSLPTKTPASR